MDRLGAVLVVIFAKRNDLEVAGLPRAVSIADDVMRIIWRRRSTNHAGQHFDAAHVVEGVLAFLARSIRPALGRDWAQGGLAFDRASLQVQRSQRRQSAFVC